MTPEQLLLQLGVAGALLFVVYKIALVVIDRWSKAEEARTKVLADGFVSLVNKVDNHHNADIASHREMGEALVEVNTKLDTAFGLTPVRGVKAPNVEADDEDTDPQSPHAIENQSIPTKPRPTTQGGQYHMQPAKRRT